MLSDWDAVQDVHSVSAQSCDAPSSSRQAANLQLQSMLLHAVAQSLCRLPSSLSLATCIMTYYLGHASADLA